MLETSVRLHRVATETGGREVNKPIERWLEVKAASVNQCGAVHRRNVAAALREDIAEVEAFDADNPNLPAMRQTLADINAVKP